MTSTVHCTVQTSNFTVTYSKEMRVRRKILFKHVVTTLEVGGGGKVPKFHIPITVSKTAFQKEDMKLDR